MKLHLAIILILLFTGANFGQTPSSTPPLSDDQPIRVDTLLVSIPVIASDRDGRNVAGLKKENFTILQDGEKQPIEFFADEEAPMNVAIIIDLSGSTAPVLNDIKRAARDFIKVLRPEDKATIVGFAQIPFTLCDLTSDHKKLEKGLDRVIISGQRGSNMEDAVYQSVTQDLAAVKGRKAIIVLTDGLVVGRNISDEKLLYTVSEADVLVYPILFKLEKKITIPETIKTRTGQTLTREEIIRRLSMAEKEKREFMDSLAAATAGQVYESGANDFRKTFQQIADELKKQYIIGFYPSGKSDEKPHQISVKVSPQDIVIRTKRNIQFSRQ